MTYELMVFEPETVPVDHAAFLDWYREQLEFGEPHSYGELDLTTERLRAWFLEFEPQFPADDEVVVEGVVRVDKSSTTSYGIAFQFIYFGVDGSDMEAAYQAAFELAGKHGVGLFNAGSKREEVWLPEDGKLVLAHQGAEQDEGDEVGWWERIVEMFRRR